MPILTSAFVDVGIYAGGMGDIGRMVVVYRRFSANLNALFFKYFYLRFVFVENKAKLCVYYLHVCLCGSFLLCTKRRGPAWVVSVFRLKAKRHHLQP